MRTQKAISARIDTKLMERVKKRGLCMNRALNDALDMYLLVTKLHQNWSEYRKLGESFEEWRELTGRYIHRELRWLFRNGEEF